MENTNTQIQSKIITQEMVEGKYNGKIEKIFKKFFRWMMNKKDSLRDKV